MPHFALSAIGRDRPGIVAAVTAVLLEHGVNVEDSQMAILAGHFSMTLVLALPDNADADALTRRTSRRPPPSSAWRACRSTRWRRSRVARPSRRTS